MQFLKKWLFYLFLLVIFLVGLIAAVDNSQEVALTFLDWQSPEFPLSWWVLAAFVLGVVFGMVINFFTNTKLRLAARKATRAVEKTTRELDKAKAAPAPGSPSTAAGSQSPN